MNLASIAIFSIGAAIYGWIVPAKWRGWALLIASLIAIYWLQPAIPLRPLDFVLPTATVVLAIIGWLLVRQDDQLTRENSIALGITALVVVALAVIGGSTSLTPSPPPAITDIVFALIGVGALLATLTALAQHNRNAAISVLLLVIVGLFVILKSQPLAEAASAWLRSRTGRPLSLAQAGDLQWLGFSYVSFRMISTLRDRQSGKLPALSLREYLTYLLFFPAYTAGPIDRPERFIKDYRVLPRLDAARLVEGGSRIVIGIFKKFVIADSLAIFSLDASRAAEAPSAGALWLLLYAYTLRIYFDFSGYSDIAIGIGILFGIKLPENFDRPYLKDNLTAFWQSWHITLSNWVRFYVFTPLSRFLLTRPRKPSPTMIVLITQIVTMVVIGLWHGITLNFVIWGLWHGIGLFVHKLFTDRTRAFYQGLKDRPREAHALSWLGMLITFHYVALGWLWFALPDPALSFNVLRRLFGGG
jgi:alginate O-acetyltransferase complex protein AlgI